MINTRTFISIPNWLHINGHKLPVIITGRRATCWHCKKTGYSWDNTCPHTHKHLLPSIDQEKKETPIVLPTVEKKRPEFVIANK